MAFIDQDDKYQKWKYIISEVFVLYPDGSQTEIPAQQITSIDIIHLYEKNLFPIFKVDVVLASVTYYKILKNKEKVKFKLRIQKFYTEIGDTEPSLVRDWINDTFDLILDDADYNSEESILKEKREKIYDTVTDKELENDLYMVDNKMEFFLFKSELVDKFNKVVNAVISNATINDGLQYIASVAGLSNILMTTPQNQTSYPELIIPPLKAKYAIKYLDTYYGIYKTGMMFYSDMVDGTTYLIDYSEKCTAYKPKELRETNILIPLKSSKYSSDMCSLKKKSSTETNFIIGDNTTISIRNETISMNAYAATDAKFIDPYSGDITASSSTATVKNTKSETIVENTTENKWVSDIYKTLVDSKNVVIDVVLSDYDIAAISPNKTYKIVFEDTALSSKYKKSLLISEITHSLKKEGNYFTLASIARFRQL